MSRQLVWSLLALGIVFSPGQQRGEEPAAVEICPIYDVVADISGSVNELYFKYDFKMDSYPFCYYCQNFPPNLPGDPRYVLDRGYHQSGTDGDCGCVWGGPFTDHTSQWRGVYKRREDLARSERRGVSNRVTCQANHTDNPTQGTAVDCGPALNPGDTTPHHDRSSREGDPLGWIEEESLSMIYELSLVYSPPAVKVEFSSGGSFSDNPFDHIVAWVESADGCPPDGCTRELVVSFPPGETLALGVTTENLSVWGLVLILPETPPFQIYSTLLPACFDEFFAVALVNPGDWFMCAYLYDLVTAELQLQCSPA